MHIGPYRLDGKLILAPMAGITDRPFRKLCRNFGAALAYTEMVSSRPDLQNHPKTLLRSDLDQETEPRAIQILGADPQAMAEAARLNVERGAQIIDINMGCPARKVCHGEAGSALLKDEVLAGQIMDAVVRAVTVPVTLKIRTGWDRTQINGVRIAKIAESAGIQALTVHGRTRACGFSGPVDYSTIAEVKAAVAIPVIANGDIDSAEKAREILRFTAADALMIGRAALGRPWFFHQAQHYLQHGITIPDPGMGELRRIVERHLSEIHEFYGEHAGIRIARKHIAWYARGLSLPYPQLLKTIQTELDPHQQIQLTLSLFKAQTEELAA